MRSETVMHDTLEESATSEEHLLSNPETGVSVHRFASEAVYSVLDISEGLTRIA